MTDVALRALELKVSGEVQRVGYRRLVEKTARSLKITGYVKNLKDGTVKIVAEGTGDQLEEFLQALHVKEPPIFVEDIEKKGRQPTGRYGFFQVRPGSLTEELQEGLGAGQEQLTLLRREFKGYREEFRDYREEFKDYREEFRGFAKRTDENFRLILKKYGEISEKLTTILETLAKESKETREQLARAVNMLTEAIQLLRKT